MELKIGLKLLGGALASAVIASSSVYAWYPYSEKYTKWQADRPLTMTAWHNSVPRDRLDDRIARFKAAGLNQFYWLKPLNARHFFKAANAAGLEWQCGMRGGENAVRQAMTIAGCSAITVSDEPNTISRNTEEEKDAVYQELRDSIAWVKKNYPHVLVYANLSIMKIGRDRYIEFCQPDVFSYDDYALARDGSDTETFLYFMNIGRETSRKHRLPFWMIQQAYGRPEGEGVPYRNPDEADLRYQAFSFLAHGGVGITFFMYYGYAGDVGNGECMVDDLQVPHMGRTPSEQHRYENTVLNRSYYAARDMAPEIQNLSRALLNLRTVGDIGYAGTLPYRCKLFDGHGALKSVKNLETPNESVLVSFFDDAAGEEYFMVVNLRHGINMSKMDAAGTIRVTFDNSVEKIERLNRLTGLVEVLVTKPGEGDVRVLDVRQEGGTGDLYKWSNGNPWDLRPKQ